MIKKHTFISGRREHPINGIFYRNQRTTMNIPYEPGNKNYPIILNNCFIPAVRLPLRTVRPAQHRDDLLDVHDGIPGHGEIPGSVKTHRVPQQHQQRKDMGQVGQINPWNNFFCNM